MPPAPTWIQHGRRAVAVALVAAPLCLLGFGAAAQVAGTVSTGPAWSSLTAAQKNALRPLERDWDSIEPARRGKWLVVANKLPSMPPEEQARIQTRMGEWARLTPKERGQARMNFKEAEQISPQERRARWEAYKALPPDQRSQLAARAAPPAPAPAPAANSRKATPEEGSRNAKSNLVPNSSYAPRPKAIAPTVAQSQPGATTNLITRRPSPPAHQQTGMPKIATSSGFIDQATLLPKRGPQGAATRSASAAAPSTPRP